MTVDRDYVEFTEESNAVDYLDKAVAFIKSAERNPTDWKCVILAIYGALYGFMICALKGTDPDNVSVGKAKKKLMSFGQALARCQNPGDGEMCMAGFTKPLQLSDDEIRALDYVKDVFRNRFVHYEPGLWFIELHGMPRITMHALDVIRYITTEMGCYFTQFDAKDRARIGPLLDEGMATLRNSQLFRAVQSAESS